MTIERLFPYNCAMDFRLSDRRSVLQTEQPALCINETLNANAALLNRCSRVYCLRGLCYLFTFRASDLKRNRVLPLVERNPDESSSLRWSPRRFSIIDLCAQVTAELFATLMIKQLYWALKFTWKTAKRQQWGGGGGKRKRQRAILSTLNFCNIKENIQQAEMSFKDKPFRQDKKKKETATRKKSKLLRVCVCAEEIMPQSNSQAKPRNVYAFDYQCM